jgi:hypothetical protein
VILASAIPKEEIFTASHVAQTSPHLHFIEASLDFDVCKLHIMCGSPALQPSGAYGHMLRFILAGFLIALALFLSTRISSLYGKAAILVAGIALFIIGDLFIAGFDGDAQSLGPDSWYNAAPFREIILYALMLSGMAAYAITNAIDERRPKLAAWRQAGGTGPRPTVEIDLWEFFYPFIISFITFGVLISQLSNPIALSVSALVIAFQTGFFWQTIISKVRGGS